MSPQVPTKSFNSKRGGYDAAMICRLLRPTVLPEECVRRDISTGPSTEDFLCRVSEVTRKLGGIEGLPTSLGTMCCQEVTTLQHIHSPEDERIPGAMFVETMSMLNEGGSADADASPYQEQWEAHIRECSEDQLPFLRHAPEQIVLPEDPLTKGPQSQKSPPLVSLLRQPDRMRKFMESERGDTMAEFLQRTREADIKLNLKPGSLCTQFVCEAEGTSTNSTAPTESEQPKHKSIVALLASIYSKETTEPLLVKEVDVKDSFLDGKERTNTRLSARTDIPVSDDQYSGFHVYQFIVFLKSTGPFCVAQLFGCLIFFSNTTEVELYNGTLVV